VPPTLLDLEHLLHHESGSPAGHVLIEEQDCVSLFHGAHYRVLQVERIEGLHVDDLGGDSEILERTGGLQSDCAAGPIGDDRDIRSLPENLGHPKRYRELAHIVGYTLLEPVAVENLDHQPRIVASEQRVVEARSLGHVARHCDVDTAQGIQHDSHRRA